MLILRQCRRRRRGAPPCRRHARGGGRFPVLLPLRDRNRLWFGPTKLFRVGRYMTNRRSINLRTLPQWVYTPILISYRGWKVGYSRGTRTRVGVAGNLTATQVKL